MSPRTVEQLAALKVVRKEQIIKQTLKLFATKGYFNTSISDIAKKLKISKGLLYNYFGSKEELLNEVISFGLNKAFEDSIKITENIGEQPPNLIFRTAIEKTLEEFKEKEELWRLLLSLAIHVGSIPSVHQTILRVYKTLTEELEVLLTSMGYANPKTEAIKLGALLDGIGIQYLIFGDEYPLEEIKENIISSYTKNK